jgi:hypothetical protein
MKRTQIILAGLAATITLSTPMAASAAPWQNINQRQAQLDKRIDQGVRNGALNRNEAYRLRAEFRQIAQLEARYRIGGLNLRERADLDRRFDRLSAKIRFEKHDRQHRGRR